MKCELADDELLVLIYDLLYRLGATAQYTGFFHTAHSVLLAYKDPTLLTAATKLLYPETADYYHTSWKNVERNIRYLEKLLWQEHPNRFSHLAGCVVLTKPTPVKFIFLLTKKLTQLNKK